MFSGMENSILALVRGQNLKISINESLTMILGIESHFSLKIKIMSFPSLKAKLEAEKNLPCLNLVAKNEFPMPKNIEKYFEILASGLHFWPPICPQG